MQANPVLFMQLTVESLNNVFIQFLLFKVEETGKECIRLLRLLQTVVGHVKPEMDNSKLAVIQATNIFKRIIQ